MLQIEYYRYSFHAKPIYYALKLSKDLLQEFIWNGKEWVENPTNYLTYLRSEGNPYLDLVTEEEISTVADFLV